MPENQRGKCIAFAYSASMICTAVLGFAPNNLCLIPPCSLFIYSACIITAFIMYSRLAHEDFAAQGKETIPPFPYIVSKKYGFALLFSFVLLVSILYGISSQFMASFAYEGVNIPFSRGFTAAGLILAGYLADKKRKYAFFISILAISFSYLLLLMYKSPEMALFASSLTYFITGLYVLYPLVVFTDYALIRKPALISGLGVLSLRVGTIISYLIGGLFILKNQFADTILITVLFALLLLLAALLYDRLYSKTQIMEKTIEIKVPEYISAKNLENAQKDYELTLRETEVLKLILSGLTARETAANLFITERTVKAHLSSIYRKTSTKNRVELTRLISDKDYSGKLANAE